MEHPDLRRVLQDVTEELLPAYPVIRAGIPQWVPREGLTLEEVTLITRVPARTRRCGQLPGDRGGASPHQSEETMSHQRERIILAIGRIESLDELRAIRQALRRRHEALEERERTAQYLAAWDRAQTWPIGTTVYNRTERMLLGDQRYAFKAGERFIVRRFMPRAKAVCFELPDRPDWKKGYPYRAGSDDLHYFDFHQGPSDRSPTGQGSLARLSGGGNPGERRE